jgi:hypothetical protein
VVNGKEVARWERATAQEAIDENADFVRCTECHGAVIKFRQLSGPYPPHVEHRSPQDSENCRAGSLFRGKDREHRMSLIPQE